MFLAGKLIREIRIKYFNLLVSDVFNNPPKHVEYAGARCAEKSDYILTEIIRDKRTFVANLRFLVYLCTKHPTFKR